MQSALFAARSYRLGAFLLFLSLLFPGVVHGSDLQALKAAPTVVATAPAHGATAIAPGAFVEVRFSEPMNASSLLYVFEPAVAAVASWPLPDRLRLQPDPPGLAGCTVYRVQVAAEDADEGLSLVSGGAPNPWSFMTACDRPFLVATSPADGQRNVPADSPIVVTFSEPMDPLSPTPLLLSPTPSTMITGWDATRTVLTAQATLQPGTTYRATASGRDDDGNGLVSSLVPNPWMFTVNKPPQVVGPTLGASGCLDSGTDLTISWSMSDDLDSPANLSVRLSFLDGTTWRVIAGPLQGLPSPASYTWTLPTLDIATRIRLEVNDSAGALAVQESESFRIDSGPPRIVATGPADGMDALPINSSITILFYESMNRTSVSDALAVDPVVEFAFVEWTAEGDAITLHPTRLLDRTTYRVTVGVLALDLCGPGRPMATPYVFSFSTGKAPPSPPSRLWATEVEERAVSLIWEPPTTFITGRPIPEGTPISYRVYRGLGGTEPDRLILETNATRVTDPDLQPSVEYVYRVVALVDGLASESTPALVVRTRDPFFQTSEGRYSVLLTAALVGVGVAVGVRVRRRRRKREAQAWMAREVREIVALVRRVRTEPDVERRRKQEEALQARFRAMAEGEEESNPRLEGLYRALAQALVDSPEVDVAQGRQAVDARLGSLATAIRGHAAAYRLLSEAEASVRSELFRGLPESARKALLLVYFYGLEDYLSNRIRGLVPPGATILLGERGHINARRRGWEAQWAALTLGNLLFVLDRNTHFFVENPERWTQEVKPLLREAVEARNKTAHPSEVPPELARVRQLVYDALTGLEGVLRTGPTSGVAA